MGNLNDVREHLRKSIAEDETLAFPHHPAFEVEDLRSRQNFSIVFDEKSNTVVGYNTSRNCSREEICRHGPEKFPFNLTTAKDTYDHLFQKAVKGVDNIFFIGYVDPTTFKPLE